MSSLFVGSMHHAKCYKYALFSHSNENSLSDHGKGSSMHIIETSSNLKIQMNFFLTKSKFKIEDQLYALSKNLCIWEELYNTLTHGIEMTDCIFLCTKSIVNFHSVPVKSSFNKKYCQSIDFYHKIEFKEVDVFCHFTVSRQKLIQSFLIDVN